MLAGFAPEHGAVDHDHECDQSPQDEQKEQGKEIEEADEAGEVGGCGGKVHGDSRAGYELWRGPQKPPPSVEWPQRTPGGAAPPGVSAVCVTQYSSLFAS